MRFVLLAHEFRARKVPGVDEASAVTKETEASYPVDIDRTVGLKTLRQKDRSLDLANPRNNAGISAAQVSVPSALLCVKLPPEQIRVPSIFELPKNTSP